MPFNLNFLAMRSDLKVLDTVQFLCNLYLFMLPAGKRADTV